MSDNGRSSLHMFCRDEIVDAINAVEAVKGTAGEWETVATFGLGPQMFLAGVANLIQGVSDAAQRMEIPLDEVGQTLYIDGFLAGIALALIASGGEVETDDALLKFMEVPDDH